MYMICVAHIMPRNDLQGSLDLLVLKTLSQTRSMHGYGIALHIQKASAGRRELQGAERSFEQLVHGIRAVLRYSEVIS
jgi:hypothetical protein